MADRIKITFLGTGSAIPTARRNHPAVLLQYKSENILFDCGEGTQRQFRKAALNPCKLTRILISHWHGDHALGLPGLFQTLSLNGYKGTLEIYGPRGTSEYVRKYFDLVGRDEQKINIKVRELRGGIVFESEDFIIDSTEVSHGCPALAYSFAVKEKKRLDKEKLEKLKIPNGPLLGELAKGKVISLNGKKVDGKKLIYEESGRKVSFIMDTRICDEAIKISKDADVLISEATYSKEEQEIADERGHMTSVDAAKVAKKAKVKALVLIHLSQRYEAIPKLILGEAKEIFENTIIPEDLDEVEL